jgi:RNA polymerase sigma-70 factor (ECF subfamily)
LDLQAEPGLQELWVDVRTGRAKAEGRLFEAEGRLFREVYRKAYTVALRVLGDKQDAEDAAQNCALNFWKIHHNLDQSTNVLAYVYRMAWHAAIDIVRAERHRAEDPLPDPQEPGREPAADPPNREEEFDKNRLILQLSECIRGLPEHYRKAVVLYSIGMKAKEIANIMEVTCGAARNYVDRGRAKLRACLKGREDNGENAVNKDGRI